MSDRGCFISPPFRSGNSRASSRPRIDFDFDVDADVNAHRDPERRRDDGDTNCSRAQLCITVEEWDGVINVRPPAQGVKLGTGRHGY